MLFIEKDMTKIQTEKDQKISTKKTTQNRSGFVMQ